LSPRCLTIPFAAILALALVIGFLSVGPASASASPGSGSATLPGANVTTAEACLDGEEIAFLGQINDYRTANGLPELAASQTLTAASEHHSVDMATTSHFDHVMSDGTTVPQNAAAHGYADSTIGENIAGGTYWSDAATVFEGWRLSPDHNANMLSGAFGAIGIAREYGPTSEYGWYWTTVFGGSADGEAVSCDGSAVPGPTPPPPSTSPPTTGNANATTTSDLNLRSGPSTAASILAVMPVGARVAVTGSVDGGFYPVGYAGQSGWAAADFLLLDGAAPPAATASATTTSDLNLRAGPSTADAVLLVLPPGSTVELLGETSNGFTHVSYGGSTGWAFAGYLSDDAGTPPAPSPDSEVMTTTSDLNLRAGPGLSFDVLTVMPAGAAVAPTGGSESGFIQVQYAGQVGWASADFLSGASSATPPVPATGTVTTTDLNLRAGPSTADAVLLVMPPGASVNLTGETSNGFAAITYAGTPGWASVDYLV